MSAYKSIIAIADKYNISDDVLDIIFKYVYKNNIKSCCNSFTNSNFKRDMKRCLTTYKKEYYGDNADDVYNYGRLMLKILYPKTFMFIAGRYTNQILDEIKEKDEYNLGAIKLYTYPTCHDYRTGIKGCKCKMLLNKEFMNELNYDTRMYFTQTRADIIKVIEHKNELDLAYKNKPITKIKKNMKTENYIPVLFKMCLED